MAAKERGDEFAESGVFRVNEQYSTAVRYSMSVDGDRVAGGKLVFLNGRKTVATVEVGNREEAVELIGRENVQNIEQGRGQAKGSGTDIKKGKLQSGDLAYGEAHTRDYEPANSVQEVKEREPTVADLQALEWVRRRRDQLQLQRRQQLQNEKAIASGESGHAEPSLTPTMAETAAAAKEAVGRQEDKGLKNLAALPVPKAVTDKFASVDNKYYFPDKKLAFTDKGERLETRSQNTEVVRALVEIAQEREWSRMSVKGTTEFRRTAWMEASMAGIEVSGYKPSKIEQAHLDNQLKKIVRENAVERGGDREAAQSKAQGRNEAAPAVDQGQNARQAEAVGRGATDGLTLSASAVVGALVEHGSAPYKHDAKKGQSYFVTVETEKGKKTVWGVDLERAMKDANVQVGEKVVVEKTGAKPVTATERQYDQSGREIGARLVDAERNSWHVGSVDKAAAFLNGERSKVVAQHPDLAGAYGTVALAQKFAEKNFAEAGDRQRFVDVAKTMMADKIAHGGPLPAPRLKVAERSQEATRSDEREQVR